MPLTELSLLTRCLQEGKPLPPPNVGLLRDNPKDVMDAVHTLVSRDGEVHAAEIEMMRQIRELLGIAP